MNEAACITDLTNFELDRYDWLIEHNGSLDGFTTEHGALLTQQVADNEEIKAHQLIPGYVQALAMSNENRLSLGQCLNEYKHTSTAVTDLAISSAVAFVSRLFGIDLSAVQVIRAAPHVMQSKSVGAVYSCGVTKHIVVVPEQSFDPLGVLVGQLAIAALYTFKRQKMGLAPMMSDALTQSMVAHYAMLSFAAINPDKCSVLIHLQQLVTWEFAKGLSSSPETPMGFVVSDLGEQLMQAHGGGMFRAIMQELYESMTHGRAIWFGSNNFNGMALALCLLGDDVGMTAFMRIDTGDRKLADKLVEAFPMMTRDVFIGLQADFNSRLARIISGASTPSA